MNTVTPATPSEITERFVAPLLRLYRLNAPDPDAFLAELGRHLATATCYQLERALERITRSRSFTTFPSIGEIMQAIDASPIAPPREVQVERNDHVSSVRPPALIAAERYIGAWELSDASGQAAMERDKPGFLAACMRVVEVWSQAGQRS